MPYFLGTDFHSFLLFIFCVNTVEWNIGFKRVYFGLTFISKGISLILFGSYLHYDLQSTVLVALTCSLASIAPQLQFYLAFFSGICQVVGFVGLGFFSEYAKWIKSVI